MSAEKDQDKLFDEDLSGEKYDPELDDLPDRNSDKSPSPSAPKQEKKSEPPTPGTQSTHPDGDSQEEDSRPSLQAGSGSLGGKQVEQEKQYKRDSELGLYKGTEKLEFDSASTKVFGTVSVEEQAPRKQSDIVAEITNFVKGSHVTYTIKGFDKSGEFQVLRRYSEFHSFHAALASRFPGLYIPPIPPKKAVGNTDVNFVVERRYFLDRFLSELTEIDYLAWSEEFKLFCRHSFEIDKALSTLPKISYEYLVDKYRTEFPMDAYPEDEMSRCADEIRHFAAFMKKSSTFLGALKKQVKAMIPQKQSENLSYGNFCKMLCKYEEGALNEYCGGQEGHFIIRGSEVERDLEGLSEVLKNPFKEVYFWLKGECYDCFAILEMIRSRDRLVESRVKCEKKKNDDRHALEKLQAGKKTMKSIFSTKSNADQMNALATSITKLERDIEALEEINQIVTVHIAKTVIPKLKRDKMQAYYKIIKKFSSIQSEQASTLSQIWTAVLSSTNLKHF